MSHLILVHGAWHGGWVWQRLTPMLVAAGHSPLTPTLAGLGDRAAEVTRATGLEDHVQDLLAAIGDSDHRDTILVAHSYGGIPASVAAQRVPDRLRGVVYLDARVPRDGQRGFDVWPGSEELYRHASETAGEGWLIPPPDDTFGIRDPIDLAWVRSRLTAQPLKTYEDRIVLGPTQTAVPAAAIICDGADPADSLVMEPQMPTTRITAGHDAMVSDPVTLNAALLQILDRL